ncbi:MAG: hypothetical protein QRY74_05625 [Chlamydia sp.]
MNNLKYIFLIIITALTGCVQQAAVAQVEPKVEAINYPHPIQPIISKHLQSENREDIPVEVYPEYDTKRLLDSYCAFFNAKIVDAESEKEVLESFCDSYIDMASTYNSLPEIRPYLKYFPVTTKNTSMKMICEDQNGHFYKEPSFGLVQIPRENNSIIELIRLDKNQSNHSWNYRRENVTQIPIANIPILQMLNSDPVRRCIKDRVTPLYIEDKMKNSSFLRGSVQDTRPLFSDVLEKNGLHFAAIADQQGYEDAEKREPSISIFAHFWAQNRALSEEAADQFMKKVHNECYEAAKKRLQSEVDALPKGSQFKNTVIYPKNLIISISFWDEHMDRVEAPSIAYGLYMANRSILYTANASQELRAINIPLNTEIKIADLMKWSF